jgi:hypothetical protein
MGGFKPSPEELSGDLSVGGTVTITTGQSNTKTTATHDIATAAADTQNVRAGSFDMTLDGDLTNNSAVTIQINSTAVVATDCVVACTATNGGGVDTFVHLVAAGSFRITLINRSGSTIGDDTAIKINWVAI